MKPSSNLQVCFARSDEDGLIQILSIVSFTTVATTTEDCLKRTQAAIETWIYNTEEGKDAFASSQGDFTTAALLACFDSSGAPFASLKPFLEKQGVFKIRCLNTYAGIDYINYDHLFAVPVELD